MFASADTYRHLSAYEYARPLHHINTKSARRKDQCLELDASWQLGALKILAPEDVPNSTKFDEIRRVGGELAESWWRVGGLGSTCSQKTISRMWAASDTVCIGTPAAIWPTGEAPADKTCVHKFQHFQLQTWNYVYLVLDWQTVWQFSTSSHRNTLSLVLIGNPKFNYV